MSHHQQKGLQPRKHSLFKPTPVIPTEAEEPAFPHTPVIPTEAKRAEGPAFPTKPQIPPHKPTPHINYAPHPALQSSATVEAPAFRPGNKPTINQGASA